MKKTFANCAEANARAATIILILVVSGGFAVWTYWPNLRDWIMPQKISVPTPNQTSIPEATKIPAVAENKAGLDLSKQVGRIPVVQKEDLVKPRKAENEEPLLNLVSEKEAPVESLGVALPEKLNSIKVGQKVPSKAEEKAKFMAEQAKKDRQSRTREFLQDSRVSGVRLAGKKSRLLMNGSVYHLGDIVSTELKLQIHKMSSTEIIFEDDTGKSYPLHY